MRERPYLRHERLGGEMADLSVTDSFTMAHNTLNRVDMLLVEAGFNQDSSIRHNLKIAKSMFRDAENKLNALLLEATPR
jgi:hypothetical protein